VEDPAPFSLHMTIPFDLTTYAVAAVVVFGAYVIFGISAFGAALGQMRRFERT